MSAGTPIISPWFFYIIGLIEPLIMVSLFGFLGALIFGALVWYTVIDEDSNEEEYKNAYNSIGKKCIILSIIFGLLLIFVPSQQTCIQMLIADNITYERLETVGSSVEDICDDIIAIAEKAVETTE